MRKIFVCLICFICITFDPSGAIAGSQIGKVSYILVRASDGLIYFMMTGTPENRPPCATINYWMIKDENSNAGKQQLSLLLSAQAAGRTIRVFGLDSCTRWIDGEDVNFIQIFDQ